MTATTTAPQGPAELAFAETIRYQFPQDVDADELAALRDSCNARDLRRVAFFHPNRSAWLLREWCAKYVPRSAGQPTHRITEDQLKWLFKDQVTVFVGDSVVRNHFVLTMARMCNGKNRAKCMTMMPTYEFDVVRADASTRGPLGCIPAVKGAAAATRPPPDPKRDRTVMASNVTDVADAAEAARRSAAPGSLTDCYQSGKFRFIPAPGLTSSKEPRPAERKTFQRKGTITPLIRMEVRGAVFYYVPVNKPSQFAKFARWLNSRGQRSGVGAEIRRSKLVFAGTGPHLSTPEMNTSAVTLIPSLFSIQASLGPDSMRTEGKDQA